jgi:zinc transport system substrate-binding protein
MGHLGFELSWMDKIRSVNPEMKVADLSRGIALITGDGGYQASHENHDHAEEHHHHGTDPHTWMSLHNAPILARNTFEALSTILPGKEDYLKQGLQAFLDRLDALDREIGPSLEELHGTSFMIYHPALTYLARDYHMEQLALEDHGKEPSPAHMKTLTDRGRHLGITTILVQREFDQENAKVLAAEIGAEVAIINPLDPDWEQQIRYIAEALIKDR